MPEMSAPVSVEEFQSRLVEITETSPKRLRQCADYIARHTDRIALSTVAELSVAAGVQPSALMRFCQLMGFSGYSEMQRMFRREYAGRWPDYSARLASLRAGGDDTPAALLAEFVDAGRASLEKLARLTDADKLAEVVKILAEAPMIHIVGLRRAFSVATYLAYTFENMNVAAVLHSNLANLDHSRAIRAEDAVIAITFAPYTQKTVDLAADALAKGCKVIAITDAMNSPMHQLGATTLTVAEVDVGAFRSLSAPLSLAATIAVSVGTLRSQGIS